MTDPILLTCQCKHDFWWWTGGEVRNMDVLSWRGHCMCVVSCFNQILFPWLGRGPRPEDLEKGGRENMDLLRYSIFHSHWPDLSKKFYIRVTHIMEKDLREKVNVQLGMGVQWGPQGSYQFVPGMGLRMVSIFCFLLICLHIFSFSMQTRFSVTMVM